MADAISCVPRYQKAPCFGWVALVERGGMPRGNEQDLRQTLGCGFSFVALNTRNATQRKFIMAFYLSGPMGQWGEEKKERKKRCWWLSSDSSYF